MSIALKVIRASTGLLLLHPAYLTLRQAFMTRQFYRQRPIDAMPLVKVVLVVSAFGNKRRGKDAE